MGMGSLARLALIAGVWMCGCAAGAPAQVEDDPSMLGSGGGSATGGVGGAAGSGGKGGSGGRGGSSSAGTGGTGAPGASGSPAMGDGGLLVDGGCATDGGPSSSDECSDSKKNGTETGKDCGGPDCDPCEDGTGCVIDSDCESEYCGSGFTCSTPGCDDDAKNGEETDVDCGGGDCPGCANNRACSDDDDCMSESCEDDKCACKPLEECGDTECGQKPDGCGGMVDCSHTCGGDEMCEANACVAMPACVAGDCPRCNFFLSAGCCKTDGTCGCPPAFGGSGCN